MKISYNWLKSQFPTLPGVNGLVEKITFGVFEVESVEKIHDDTVIELKILPDRAHYALSWNGIAYEVGALLRTQFRPKLYEPIDGEGAKVDINIEEPDLCRRYMARFVGDIEVAESSPWLKGELEKLNQRPINSAVDLANYIMFVTGQPLHVFDADKVDGKIHVRSGKKGEKITTLDNKNFDIDETMLVIADNSKVLGIAGIKGGKAAEVTKETKNIIIESANFDPVSLRKTSAKIKIKTEASKRFENEPTPENCSIAMDMLSSLIRANSGTAKFGLITDQYINPAKERKITFSKDYIASRIGRSINEKEILDVLTFLQCSVKESKNQIYTVVPPIFRLDLTLEEDMVEEIGRLLGYDKVEEVLPPKISLKPTVNPEFFVSERIKDFLKTDFFSEVMLYTLGSQGKLETLYPVAEDKARLRDSLMPHLEECVALNTRNADLLGLDCIKIFEIGKVFDERNETLMLGLAVGFPKKIKGKTPADLIRNCFEALGRTLSTQFHHKIIENGLTAVGEVSLEEAVKKAPVFDPYRDIDFSPAPKKKFIPYSKYQFSTRDVAVFVPAGVASQDVETVIRDNAGPLCINLRLFDTFSKDGKTSYAFRLVFQAPDHTLTEEEINTPLNLVYGALKKKGWEIR